MSIPSDDKLWGLYQDGKQTVAELSELFHVSESTIKRRLRQIDIEWVQPDLTGNRRWLPFEAERIDLEALKEIDHRALFAEALDLLKEGFCHWMPPNDLRLLEVAQHDFMVPCVEMEMLKEHFAPASNRIPGNWHTFTYIYTRLLAFLPSDRLDRKRLQQCLERLRFEKKHTARGTCYHVVEKKV